MIKISKLLIYLCVYICECGNATINKYLMNKIFSYSDSVKNQNPCICKRICQMKQF